MLSDRVLNSAESITLKLNARAEELRKSGKHVYNFTAGQLPYKPSPKLTEAITKNLNLLSSYQYSPVPGYPELREKVIDHIERLRGVEFDRDEIDCVISTGAKQSIYNLIGALVNPGEEVIILAPYWVSYPAIIKYWGGVPMTVSSPLGAAKGPSIKEIEKIISPKTKAIIINSPGNPSGVYYDEAWIKELAELLAQNPHVQIVSDEIYYDLNYYDPKPTYPYHYQPELLKRTFIIDGISKSMACTGLRIGYTIGNKKALKGMGKIQGQSTSGANSLIQKALIDYDFTDIDEFLVPIKRHLRNNAELLKECLEKYGLMSSWYQTNSAFYFFLNFEKMPVINRYKTSEDDQTDYSAQICEDLILDKGVVIVPGKDFGVPNAARMSLVLEKDVFLEGLQLMSEFLCRK